MSYKDYSLFRHRAAAQSVLSNSQDQTQRPGVTLYISLLSDNRGWLFQWPSTGDVYYRVVLRGVQLEVVVDETDGMQSYVYNGPGFLAYPPPLEITIGATLAPSEINKPFLQMQWYGETTASYYQVQEYLSGSWQTWYQIGEIGAPVYSWTTPLLVDETTHLYRVMAFNIIDQSSAALAFDMTPVVTPPDLVDTTLKVSYDGTGHNIVLALA